MLSGHQLTDDFLLLRRVVYTSMLNLSVYRSHENLGVIQRIGENNKSLLRRFGSSHNGAFFEPCILRSTIAVPPEDSGGSAPWIH
jgi:hypothetical protein